MIVQIVFLGSTNFVNESTCKQSFIYAIVKNNDRHDLAIQFSLSHNISHPTGNNLNFQYLQPTDTSVLILKDWFLLPKLCINRLYGTIFLYVLFYLRTILNTLVKSTNGIDVSRKYNHGLKWDCLGQMSTIVGHIGYYYRYQYKIHLELE